MRNAAISYGLMLACLLAPARAAAEKTVLPAGAAPPAIAGAHFPHRVHEFVWRNWNAVAPAKLAAILDTSEDNVTAIAESMGLPATPSVASEMAARGYATLIRRNWHLLPYDQLLELLEWTEERLAFTLREEDFLWIKLGRLKPACAPLRYSEPDDAMRRRAAQIRQVVEETFGDAIRDPGAPRFDFVRELSAMPADLPTARPDPSDALRIVYSYVAVYGDPLLHPELDPYPAGLLARLAGVGINGVWLQALLRDMAPGGEIFPEFGAEHERRLENLRALVTRAKTHGIEVYLYLNDPRAMPLPFFDAHPEARGVQEGDLAAMCTSNPKVRRWMGDALAHIFREVPGLGGIYTITGSENLTHCASHGGWRACARCKERSDGDILTELVGVLEEGVHRAAPSAKVLVSDWGWRGHGDARDIIARLPESVWLMSVSEWHLPIERGGVQSTVGEYSISSVGPGPRALAHWQAAGDAGLTMGTEIQFNNTCEIATIPYLPVLDLIAEHCVNLRASANLDAMLIGWTMGGHPSPNFRLAQVVHEMEVPDADAALDTVARERYGPEGAPHARKAWSSMSQAFREYPFHISVVYTSPVQWGPANPLYETDTGYSATMWGLPYDDLDGWRGPYPPEVFAAQFEKIARGWEPGIAALQNAAAHAPAGQRAAAQADLRYALAAAMHFQSVANQARYVSARDALAQAPDALPDEERARLRRDIEQSLRAEIDLARRLYDLVRVDSRIGFEPSCQYFYLPLDLVEKVINCQWLLERLES
jgi:hypothetical protein